MNFTATGIKTMVYVMAEGIELNDALAKWPIINRHLLTCWR